MGGVKQEAGTLLYWWCGEDAPVGDSWVDRIGNVPVTADHHSEYDGIDHGDDYYRLGYQTPKKTQMKGDLRDISIGRHWEIEVTFKSLTETETNNYMIDFGSYASTSRNFCIILGNRYNGIRPVSDNYKGISNNTVTTYGIDGVAVATRRLIPYNEKITIYYGCEAYDDNTDIQYLRVGDTTIYAPNPHDPVTFNSSDWVKTDFWFGRCFAYNEPSAFLLYNLKIYNYDE